MDSKIVKILNKLEKRSQKEKTRKVNVSPENRMLAITKETGELFNLMLHLKKAKNVLEIGTSTGYSTIWCAEAIKENSGKVITIEKNPEKIKRAQKNFKEAGIEKHVIIKEGIALKILAQMKKTKKFHNYFDFVLIDADKENVIQYFDLVLSLVKKDGLIITDNMLYPEKYRKKMKQFSNYLKMNSKVLTITSPIGNGEEITLKIN